MTSTAAVCIARELISYSLFIALALAQPCISGYNTIASNNHYTNKK